MADVWSFGGKRRNSVTSILLLPLASSASLSRGCILPPHLFCCRAHAANHDRRRPHIRRPSPCYVCRVYVPGLHSNLFLHLRRTARVCTGLRRLVVTVDLPRRCGAGCTLRACARR